MAERGITISRHGLRVARGWRLLVLNWLLVGMLVVPRFWMEWWMGVPRTLKGGCGREVV